MKTIYLLAYLLLGSIIPLAAQTRHLPAPTRSPLEMAVQRYSPHLRLAEAAGQTRRSAQTSITRPGSVVSYNWNPTTNIWQEPQITQYTYNAQALLSQETHTDSATAAPIYRLYYTYNAQNQSIEALQQDYFGTTWENSFRQTTAFDAQGTPTEDLNQDWISGAWSTTSGVRYANTYTASGFLAQQVVQTFDGTTAAFVNDYKLLYTIPAAGPYTEFTLQRWSGTQWEDESRVTGITWYDAVRKLPTSLEVQIPINAAWVGVQRLTATYQPNGNSVSTYELRPDPAGPWLNDSRTTETYDAYENHLSQLREIWDGAVWTLNEWSRALLTYNAQHAVLRRDEQLATTTSGGLFENQQRFNFGSFQIIPLGTSAARTAQVQLALYPNPATDRVMLEITGLTGSGPLVGEVRNGLGQVVQTFMVAPLAGRRTQELNLAPLSAGLYTVQLQTPQGIVTKRLVRQ